MIACIAVVSRSPGGPAAGPRGEGGAVGMLWRDTQLLSTAAMFLAGAALALLYDLLSIVTGRATPPARVRRRGPRVLSLWDLLFWVVATPLVFAASLVSNQGELRIYVFVGLALGAAAYHFLARAFVVNAGLATRTGLIRTGRFVGRAVARPVGAASRKAVRVAGALGRWARGRGEAAGRSVRRVAGRAGAGLAGAGRRILGGIRSRPKE
ncbi:MAG: hypothetical protein C4551_10730 [Bacillota bacterium]|nr:MAG: hypothetical protein C4551_10730 [Bacillota bacterium]